MHEPSYRATNLLESSASYQPWYIRRLTTTTRLFIGSAMVLKMVRTNGERRMMLRGRLLTRETALLSRCSTNTGSVDYSGATNAVRNVPVARLSKKAPPLGKRAASNAWLYMSGWFAYRHAAQSHRGFAYLPVQTRSTSQTHVLAILQILSALANLIFGAID